MDPGYLKYLSSYGVDPRQYIEMQANYLRLLANYYSSNNKDKSGIIEEKSEDKEIFHERKNDENKYRQNNEENKRC